MNKDILSIIKEYSSEDRIRFKKHAFIRSIERNIAINEIEQALKNCKIIESYPEDKPLTSYLLLGFALNKRPLHVLIAVDDIERYIWIITVYEPDKNKWDKTFTKRIVR
ncbi:MAG: DUF4258 domain-containing protein [Calditrichaeota bacterium]|nr:DUF4258 domain-containing protein [Calditrichota bacterium]